MSRMQQRRDTSSSWTSVNPTLASGEIGVETDTLKFKVGDGVSTWSALRHACELYNQSLNKTDNVTFNSVTLPNHTQIVVGSFDNSTGGANGLSLICAVGYEFNWQGGRLKSVYNNLTQTIHVDSPMQFDGGVLPKVVALGTGGGNMPTDASLGEIFTATADANTLIENPTNPVDGKTLRWKLSQDGTGGHTWTLGSKFVIPSSASSPLPWSTAPNKTDLLAATYDAGRDKWDIIAFVPGY